VPLNIKDKKIKTQAEKIYSHLQKSGVEVLYDDRIDAGPGEKLIESDLIGIPVRVVLSKKTLDKDSVEIKERGRRQSKLVKIKELKF